MVVAVAMLLAPLGSVVVAVTLDVLVMVEPLAALGLTLTTRVKTAVAPAASVGPTAVMPPVPPTPGVVAVKPAGLVNDTNVVLVGTVSVRITPWESEGPLLVTLM